LRVRPLLFAAAAALIGAYWTLAVTVGDTLFLSGLARDGRSVARWLPWVYVLVALASVVGAWSFGRAQRRLSHRVLVVATPLAFGAVLAALRLLIAAHLWWVPLALAVAADAVGLLSVMLFFSVAGDHFTSREGRRLYGHIWGGLPLGSLLGGALVAPLGARIGVPDLLWVAVAFLACTGPLYALANRWWPAGRGTEPADERATPASPLRRSYARWLLWLSFLTPVLFVCADLPMKGMLSARPPAEMARFLGAFYGAVGLAELIVQVAGARLVMTTLGATNTLLLFPLLVGGACAAVLGAPVLAAATVAGFLRAVVGETLEAQARELHWLALPGPARHRLQPWASGAVAPLGQGAAGLLLFTLAALGGGLRAAPAVGVLAALLVVGVVLRLRPLYLRVLGESVRFHLLDEDALGGLLRAPGLQRTRRALLASDDPEVVAVTRELLAQPAPEAARAAADVLDPEQSGVARATGAVRLLVVRGGDPPPDLPARLDRALARIALLRRARQEADGFLAPFLDDALAAYWGFFLDLYALRGGPDAADRVRRNLWTASHSEALDLLDALLPRPLGARALPLAVPVEGTGDGLSAATRAELATAGPWLRRIAGYAAGDDRRLLEEIAALRVLPLFAGVRSDLLAPVAAQVEHRTLAPDAVLVSEGAPPDALYVIVDGRVSLRRKGVRFGALAAGEAVGELGLLDGAPRTADVIAETACRVLRIPAAPFRRTLESEPALMEALLRMLCARLRATQGSEAPDECGLVRDAGRWADDPLPVDAAVRRAAFLRRVPLFRAVSAGAAGALAQLVRPVSVVERQVLFAAGDAGDALYILESGQLEIRIGARVIARLAARDFVGEMALIDGAPRSATAVVVESGRFLRLESADFANLLATMPAVGAEFLRELAARLRRATRAVPSARESSSGRA